MAAARRAGSVETLVLEPDITLGLSRQMKKAASLSIEVPSSRAVETIELGLDGIAEVRRHSGRGIRSARARAGKNGSYATRSCRWCSSSMETNLTAKRTSIRADVQGILLAHIWSPPILQGPVVRVTGTGLLPYIRPVDEGHRPSGLDEIRAYRPYRLIGIVQPPMG
jgi:hypothetical protein